MTKGGGTSAGIRNGGDSLFVDVVKAYFHGSNTPPDY